MTFLSSSFLRRISLSFDQPAVASNLSGFLFPIIRPKSIYSYHIIPLKSFHRQIMSLSQGSPSDSPQSTISSSSTQYPRPTPKTPLHFNQPSSSFLGKPSLNTQVLYRMMLTLGSCGFLTGCFYIYWMSKMKTEQQSRNCSITRIMFMT